MNVLFCAVLFLRLQREVGVFFPPHINEKILYSRPKVSSNIEKNKKAKTKLTIGGG